MILLMMLLLILNEKPIEGKGKYYLATVGEKGLSSQNITEELKDAIASYHNGKGRKGRRGEPHKGKATKKGRRRRKGKDYQDETGWLDKCSLNDPGERKEFNVPGCGGCRQAFIIVFVFVFLFVKLSRGGWANLACAGGCLSIHEVLLVLLVLVLVPVQVLTTSTAILQAPLSL